MLLHIYLKRKYGIFLCQFASYLKIHVQNVREKSRSNLFNPNFCKGNRCHWLDVKRHLLQSERYSESNMIL